MYAINGVGKGLIMTKYSILYKFTQGMHFHQSMFVYSVENVVLRKCCCLAYWICISKIMNLYCINISKICKIEETEKRGIRIKTVAEKTSEFVFEV